MWRLRGEYQESARYKGTDPQDVLSYYEADYVVTEENDDKVVKFKYVTRAELREKGKVFDVLDETIHCISYDYDHFERWMYDAGVWKDESIPVYTYEDYHADWSDTQGG